MKTFPYRGYEIRPDCPHFDDTSAMWIATMAHWSIG